jgi:hypothetical protein
METIKQTTEYRQTDKVFNHLMLDIETMGNESFSAIVSIGALEFDIETGETGKEFYVNVDLQSSMDLGLIVNASSIMWWLNQNNLAREALTEGTVLPIQDALSEFSQFCNKEYQIWGNSARFDCGILQNAYNKAGIPIPWDYRKERCVRTLVSFNPEIKNKYPHIGTVHNAISDCYYQVGYCSATWLSLINGEKMSYIETIDKDLGGNPNQLEPVLALITHIGELGISEWYEVVYYYDKWYSYSGSKTFEDGEQVIRWKYCKDCF